MKAKTNQRTGSAKALKENIVKSIVALAATLSLSNCSDLGLDGLVEGLSEGLSMAASSYDSSYDGSSYGGSSYSSAPYDSSYGSSPYGSSSRSESYGDSSPESFSSHASNSVGAYRSGGGTSSLSRNDSQGEADYGGTSNALTLHSSLVPKLSIDQEAADRYNRQQEAKFEDLLNKISGGSSGSGFSEPQGPVRCVWGSTNTTGCKTLAK